MRTGARRKLESTTAKVVQLHARRWPGFSRSEILDALVETKWFVDLSREELATIVGLTTPRYYKRGELIHGRQDPPAGLYGILSGGVRISSMNPEGREAIFCFMGAGDWFGHIGLIDGLPRTHDICAVQDSLVLCIGNTEFRRLLDAHPILYKSFALKLCELVRLAFDTIDDNALLSMEGSLAKRLLALADTYGAECTEGRLIDIHLPQRELASILGVSRQTINKKLAEWHAFGWIAIHYGQIVIVEREVLEQLSKPD